MFGCWFAPVVSIGMARFGRAAPAKPARRKSLQDIESAMVRIVEMVGHFPLFGHG
jgi:hypothetical protein